MVRASPVESRRIYRYSIYGTSVPAKRISRYVLCILARLVTSFLIEVNGRDISTVIDIYIHPIMGSYIAFQLYLD